MIRFCDFQFSGEVVADEVVLPGMYMERLAMSGVLHHPLVKKKNCRLRV